MENQENALKIAAGIVTYNPEMVRLRSNIMSIVSQVDYLVLYDNGSENIREIDALVSEFNSVDLIKSNTNDGIACALNKIVDSAENNECTWVLTLDQDSISPPNIIEVYKNYIGNEKIAMLTPRIDDENEESGTNIQFHDEIEYIERCISSASLLRITACREVGNFDEKMFIDYVDFDMCIKLVNEGYKILRVNKVALSHQVGKAKEIKLFYRIGKLLNIEKLKRPLYTYCHGPVRTYYYARNTFYYIKKHKNSINVKTEKKVFIKWFILKVFFENDKIKKLKAIIKGYKDSKDMIKELKDG